jgi:acyl carrier protein
MVREEVIKVVSNILNVPIGEVNEDSSPQTLVQWDSLQHMNLILALEEKFGIRFREDQIVDMLNVQLIILAVEELKNV